MNTCLLVPETDQAPSYVPVIMSQGSMWCWCHTISETMKATYRHLKKARLRDPASWLPLAAEASSRNLAWEFFDMSVLVSNLSYLQREHKFVRVRTYK